MTTEKTNLLDRKINNSNITVGEAALYTAAAPGAALAGVYMLGGMLTIATVVVPCVLVGGLLQKVGIEFD